MKYLFLTGMGKGDGKIGWSMLLLGISWNFVFYISI